MFSEANTVERMMNTPGAVYDERARGVIDTLANVAERFAHLMLANVVESATRQFFEDGGLPPTL